MKVPPVDVCDLVAMGIDPRTSIGAGNGELVITPTPGKLLRRLIALMVSSPPPDSDTDRMGYLRHVRDALMLCTDWTQANDSPLDASQRGAWAVYRQSLRDLPEVYQGSGPIPWPREPS